MAGRNRPRARTVVALAAVVAATMAGTTAAQAVIGADEGANAAYGFAARVQIGDRPGRGCSGALVAPQCGGDGEDVLHHARRRCAHGEDDGHGRAD